MKKFACLALAIIMMLSLTACPNRESDDAPTSSGLSTTMSETGSDNTSSKKEETSSQSSAGTSVPNDTSSKDKNTSSKNKDTSSNQRPTASESGGILDIINPPKPQSSEPEHEHVYEKTVKLASCNSGGYEKYTCDCGDSYKENVVGPTYKHEFKEDWIVGESMWYPGFGCTKCGLKVLDMEGWWNDYVKTDKVRWYVTGTKVEKANGDFSHDADLHIVVCGKGAIIDYKSNNGAAPWYEYVNKYLKKITIAEGVTTIGEYAFYSTVKEKRKVEFDMADSVKRINKYGIHLNMYDLTLGSGVEEIKENGIDAVNNLYIPKSVKTFYDLGNYRDTHYYYEGDLDALYKIQVQYSIADGNLIKYVVRSYKERCERYYDYPAAYGYYDIVILNSSKIKKGNAVFDGRTVKTDSETLSYYVK